MIERITSWVAGCAIATVIWIVLAGPIVVGQLILDPGYIEFFFSNTIPGSAAVLGFLYAVVGVVIIAQSDPEPWLGLAEL